MSDQGIKCECGKINRVGMKFCTQCGKPLDSEKTIMEDKEGFIFTNSIAEKTCPACKSVITSDMKFCKVCGTPLNSEKTITDDKMEFVLPNDIAEKICPNCNSSVREGLKFCTKCGWNLEQTEVSQNTIILNDADKNDTELILENDPVSDKNKCPKCGNANMEGVYYCKTCGTKLRDNGTEHLVENNDNETESPKEGKKSNVLIWIISIIVALILIVAVACGYLYYSNNPWFMNMLSQFGIVSAVDEDDADSEDSDMEETERTDSVDEKENTEEIPAAAAEEVIIEDVDVFASIDVIFVGVNGEGSVELFVKNNYQGIDYVIDKNEDLSNDDTINVSLSYKTSKNDFIEKNGIRPTTESKKYTVTGLEDPEIKANTLSKEVLEDIFEKYDAHYKNAYNSPNSYMVLDFLNNDDVPEMLVQYDGTVDVFEYVDGDVCALAAFREENNNFLYSPTEQKFILSGFITYAWMYVYSLDPQNVGYLEGVRTGNDGAYHKVVGYDGNEIEKKAMTAEESDAFRKKYKDDNYLIYHMSENKKFQNAEEAYNYLVGVSESRSAGTLKGSDVAKLPILNIESGSVLNVNSSDNSTYFPNNMCDGDVKTAWCEGEEGLGEGVSFTIKLDGYHQISAIKIYNGYLKTKDRYTINGKATNIQLSYGKDVIQDAGLMVMKDNNDPVQFANNELNPTVIIAPNDCITNEITITIVDAVAGTKYEDVAISEIEIFGR